MSEKPAVMSEKPEVVCEKCQGWGYIDIAREPPIFVCDDCGNEQAVLNEIWEIWEGLPPEVRKQIEELVKDIELENMLVEMEGNGKSDEIEPPIH